MDTCSLLLECSCENPGECYVDATLLELVTVADGVASTTRGGGDGPAFDHDYLAIFAVVQTYAAGRA
jgi:hypothetical protein